MLPRLDGHDAASGHGLRAALRVRHVPADHQGWLAARTAGQLAAPPGPLGGRASSREGGGQAELLVRGARRDSARHRRQAIQVDRHSLRSPGRGLRRQDHQHASPVGRGCARLFRFSGVQPRGIRRRGGRDARGGILDARAVSRRFHAHGAGAALRAGVFSGRLFAGRSRATISAAQCRLDQASGKGRHPAQRHASQHGRARTDAHSAGRRPPRLGPGLGHHAADSGLHKSHAAARSPGEVARRLVRDVAAAPPGDHLRNQSPTARFRSGPVPRRRGPRARG